MAYTPNNPNGQALSAASAPVVLASDQSAIPTKDIFASYTFSLTAAGNTATYDVSGLGYSYVSVDITSQGTSSLVAFATSNDNFVTSRQQVLQVSSATSTAPSISTSGTGIYAGAVYGRYFRLTVSGITAGTTAGTIVFTREPITHAALPNSISASLTAGSNVAGKFGIDQTTPGTTNAVVVGTTTAVGSTSSYFTSTASTNSTLVKASAAGLYGLEVFNTSATVAYFKLFNMSVAPTVGTSTPVKIVMVPPNGGVVMTYAVPIRLSNGLAYSMTANLAVSDTTAIAANQLVVNFDYV